MSEQLPAPDFDAQNYARPNQDWICGHACEGKPCPLGPDKKGHCQATFECSPKLDKKPGETKGRWRCTRPGGACESGPLPDGTCCRPIPKCSPEPTLRRWRGRLTRAVVAATVGVLLILLGLTASRAWFINPGEISYQHTSPSFARHYGTTNEFGETCAACHQAANTGLAGMTATALNATPGPFDFLKFLHGKPAELTAIDAACQKCHAPHQQHRPGVLSDVSCSFCHREHQGAVMAAPTDRHCAFCHGDASRMAAAAKAVSVTAAARTQPGQLAFQPPRPAGGYTRAVNTFASDHPEFRSYTDGWLDPDTLKFNHKLHLTGDTIPLLDGQKLDCAYCHQPDSSGAYMKRISFEASCRACHSLQFDVDNPGLRLPHGNVEFVRAFLRSLPTQYASYAAQAKGLTNRRETEEFVRQQLAALRARSGSGEQLEREIFTSDLRSAPTQRVAGMNAEGRSRFAGCATCHEVGRFSGGDAPELPAPVLMDRWLARGNFNHAKHQSVACEKCHAVRGSTDTADVLLPQKASCTTCHSPAGGIRSDCALCHHYHEKE